MASLVIRDLPRECTLDTEAMSAIRGAGGSWVFGWITPYVERSMEVFPAAGSGGSRGGDIYNISNTVVNQFFIANQLSFQNQMTDVINSGANASVNVGANQASANSLR